VPPEAPATPVVTNVELNITVSWTEPQSVTRILNYTILVQCADGTWEPTSYCNGADTTVMADLKCTLPQVALSLKPFNLT
jgi:hypothetical protein